MKPALTTQEEKSSGQMIARTVMPLAGRTHPVYHHRAMSHSSHIALSVPHPAFSLIAPRQTDRGPAQLLRHSASGARVLWLPISAAEPVFTISFPTRPKDDRGAAHVLEHLIFRGSARYRADPLYPALTEATMGSFLNASTRPDYTTFHAAAPTDAGLLPILQVLMDAVFNPRLEEQAFREEAWERPAGATVARGVILSEMRDYLSGAENALAQGLRAAVLGGGDGAFNQGGDPESLLQLTPEQVRAFHRAAFTPRNAWITLWGGSPDAFVLIDDALSRAGETGAETAPARVGAPLPQVTLPHGSGLSRSGFAWLLPKDCAAELVVLLNSLCFQAPDAVFRDLEGVVFGPATGIVSDISQPFLTLSLACEEAADVHRHIQRLSAGLPLARVEAALTHAVATWYDADVTPRRPLGLQVFDPLIAPWLHGGDAFEHLDIGLKLRELRRNPAKAHLLLTEVLRQIFGGTGPDSFVRLVPAAGSAARAVTMPEPATGRALPFRPLTLAGPAPQIPANLPGPEIETWGAVSLIRSEDAPLCRLRVAFVAGTGAAGGLPGLALALSHRLARDGELAASARGVAVRAGACGGQGVLWLQLTSPPEEFPRVSSALLRVLSQRAAVIPGGPASQMRALMLARPQSVIGLRLRAGLSASAALQDALAGPGLVLRPEDPAQELRLTGRVLIAASGVPEADLMRLHEDLTALTRCPAPDMKIALGDIRGDGFALPVGFHSVGLGFRTSHPAALRVLLKASEAAFLWPQIRGAGGAYGLRSELTSEGEAVIFTARDPHLLRSLDLLRSAITALRSDLTEELLARARSGAAGQLLTPPGPQDLLEEVLRAQITGTGFRRAARAELQQLRQLTLQDLRDAAQDAETALAGAKPVIIGPEASLRAALAERPGLFTLHSDRQSPGSAPR